MGPGDRAALNRWLERGPWLPAATLAWAGLATAIGHAAGSRLLLPILQVLPPYAAMLMLLHHGRRRRAVAIMLMWALGLAMAGTGIAALAPERAAEVVWNGAAYRDEMFSWLRTGDGAEADAARFLPLHLRDLALFLVLSIGTASLLSMTMGAALMNYMSFYVGSLLAQAESIFGILLFGWPLYSLIRVAAFVVLGVVLAEPVMSRLASRRFAWAELRPWMIGAGIALGLDVAIKWIAAGFWRQSILAALGPGFGGS